MQDFFHQQNINMTIHALYKSIICTLPETNIAPKNRRLEHDISFLGWPSFRDVMLVSGSVGVGIYSNGTYTTHGSYQREKLGTPGESTRDICQHIPPTYNCCIGYRAIWGNNWGTTARVPSQNSTQYVPLILSEISSSNCQGSG